MATFKALFAAAIVCTTLSCIMLVVALSSTGWIAGCIDARIFAMPMFMALASRRNATGPDFNLTEFIVNLDIGDEQTPITSANSSDPGKPVEGRESGNAAGHDFNLTEYVTNLDIGDEQTPATSRNSSGPGKPVEQGNSTSPKTNVCFSIGFFKMSIGGKTITREGSTVPIPVVLGSILLVVAILSSAAAVFFLLMAAFLSTESYEEKGVATARSRIGIILLVVAVAAGLCGVIVDTASSGSAMNNPMVLVTQLGTAVGHDLDQLSTRKRRSTKPLSAAEVAETKIMASMMHDEHFNYAFYFAWCSVILLPIAAGLAFRARQRLISDPYNEQGATIL